MAIGDAGYYYLNQVTRPTGSVTVIFPVLGNTKSIDRKTQLLVHKEKAPEDDESEITTSNKRKVVAISNVSKWRRQYLAMSAASSAKSGKKANGSM